MADPRYLVGIDLGTTNSAVATLDSTVKAGVSEILSIEQITAPGEVEGKPLLPSALYLPGEHELAAGALKLPWGDEPQPVGVFAREQGARVPGRVVTSAKSWLCHPGVDRTAAILPWGAPADVPRVSPVEASARFLKHLAGAWDRRYSQRIRDQAVVLTVPASFDEGARELTVEAAKLAGLGDVTLIEEPLAAFYSWIESTGANVNASLAGVSLVLVVDIGGGTSDFTLIQASPGDDGLRLDRTAVGDHLLLGGDNIDLAIAKICEQKLGGALDAASWGQLVLASRSAKEALLVENAPEKRAVTVLGRSSKLIGGARSVELLRDDIRKLVLDGFYPQVPITARPDRRGGLRELGLPYASDAAVTKHLAGFLGRHLAEGQRVDAVLFNGGSLAPPVVTNRLLDVLEAWGGVRPKVLPSRSLDLAVAYGAAYYGLVRRGQGVRVGGGSARAYFLGVSSDGGHKAVCIVPRGAPEGVIATLPDRDFVLSVGRPVQFEVLSSTSRKAAKPGDVVDTADADDLVQLPHIQTIVRGTGGATDVHVRLESGITEIGTLALFCASSHDRYKLEFQLRGASDDAGVSETASLPKRFSEVRETIDKFYGKKPSGDVEAKDVKQVQKLLERVVGEREGWSVALCREIWSIAWGHASRRRRSVDHERQWMMLAGWALRPGFGAALDDWRSKETFGLFAQGLQFHTESGAWDQWWILWRRIAGGLDDTAQTAIVEYARPWLEPPTPGKTRPKPKGPRVEGFEELARLLASLERVDASLKSEIGSWLWHRLATVGGSHWIIGRLGTRVPLYGSAHQVVPVEVAEDWISRLLKLDWTQQREAAFAAAMLARLTGDRARDVSDELRAKVIDAMTKAKSPEPWIRPVREIVALEALESARAFGDSLPAGIKLLR